MFSRVDLINIQEKTQAKGFRLPTSNEWELAAVIKVKTNGLLVLMPVELQHFIEMKMLPVLLLSMIPPKLTRLLRSFQYFRSL